MQDGFSFGKGRFFMPAHQGGGESIAQILDFRKKAKIFLNLGLTASRRYGIVGMQNT
jgi:hypothetical protein